ncbi:MAG: M1 family metallopeptidase [Planctomycetota bacterium]|nr:M1 family metallopeptidase [Planctomycetota bacterium]
MRAVIFFSLLTISITASAHDPYDDVPPPFLVIDKLEGEDPFRQLDDVLPTPTEARLASGAPGPRYWQQRADMDIEVHLDAENHSLHGKEKVTYHNQSPHTLTYLWMQLDQNRFRHDSIGNLTDAEGLGEEQSISWLRRLAFEEEFQGGYDILGVKDANGSDLAHVIVDTMMRIDLPFALKPGEVVEYEVEWKNNIVNADLLRARGGYEWFEETNNAIYEIAQWFPRMCAYTDYAGWQNKQFIGSGEFALEFGDYRVAITAPDTFIVSASGKLMNEQEVLTTTQRDRLRIAEDSNRPLFIVTPEEALANEEKTSNGEKTWIFDAKDVRDFAWAASPKFIWDAMGVNVPGGTQTMAMSFYPNEGEPLWSRYSTHAIAHTVEVFSRISIPYPYPVAISVNGPVGGMEYPMICFNGPRPEEDGTYSERTKYGLIGVIIHEVGHNWFPMIINSDERQWTWMDEGLNTFVQFIAEQLWEEKYPSRRGEARNIIGFTTSTHQVPIMTNSEQLIQFGNNAYAKPATALNILRESVMGRELFDFAFREYSRRWAFRRPEPADLYRTLEDASGIDLDWFWRGWFYSTDHCDLAIDRVVRFHLDTGNPDVEKPLQKEERDSDPEWISRTRNEGLTIRTERFPELLDFYNSFDELDVTEQDRRGYERFLARLKDGDAELMQRSWNFTVLQMRNFGGLMMPIPLKVTYESGNTEDFRLPAEVWRQNPRVISKLLVTPEPIVRVEVDAYLEIADADRANNVFPPEIDDQRFKIRPDSDRSNPMQRDRDERMRIEANIAAIKLGKEIVNKMKSNAGQPVPAAARILGEVDPYSLIDPWGQNFAVFDSDHELEWARIISSGPDGEPGSEDDISWQVFKDGRIEELVVKE